MSWNNFILVLIRVFFLIAFQIIILDNVQFNQYISPKIYILIILSLPFEISAIASLLLAFFVGLILDACYHTGGIHAFASITAAFVRHFALIYLKPREGYDFLDYPSIKTMGIAWYASYLLPILFLHHLLIFYLDAFKLSQFFLTFGRVMATYVATLLIIFLGQGILLLKSKNK